MKHRTVNGIDVDIKSIENTFLPASMDTHFSLVELYVMVRCGMVKKEHVPYHFMTLLSEVIPELDRGFRPQFINDIDVGLPFIKCTFKDIGYATLSLTELYLFEHEGALKREDLPEHIAALLDAVKPGLDKNYAKIFDFLKQ